MQSSFPTRPLGWREIQQCVTLALPLDKRSPRAKVLQHHCNTRSPKQPNIRALRGPGDDMDGHAKAYPSTRMCCFLWTRHRALHSVARPRGFAGPGKQTHVCTLAVLAARERDCGIASYRKATPPTMRAHAPSSFPHRRIARIYRLSSHRYSGSADPFRRRPGPRFGSQSLPNVTASICRRRRKTQACPCTHLHHHHHHQLLHHPHPNTHHVLPAPAPRHLLPCLVVRPSYPPGSRRQPASNSVKRAQCLVTMAGLPCMAPSSPSPRSLDVRPHGRPSGHVPSCSANV